MIDNSTVQQVFDTVNIVDIIGDFVSLQKRGANHIGLCPFHDEKTPSFSVSSTKGIYKCFGCGNAGNAITFLQEHEALSFPEAIKYIANKYNIPIIETEDSKEYKEEKNLRESLLLINNFANDFFINNLFETDKGSSIALPYLKEREISKDSIKQFQIGYADDIANSLLEKTRIENFNIDLLISLGLVSEYNKKFRDKLNDRIIFPIHSLSGQIIAFAGRTLRNDNKKIAKYLNSPENDLYHKSNILYGLFQAKREIIKKDKVYLVEGYTDVIGLHQIGIENCVSSSGTSLTEKQIKLIRRFTRNITIIYDGDEAGIKASLRGIDLVLKEDMNVRIIALPVGEDPDSFAKKNQLAYIKTFLEENEADFIIFKTKLIKQKDLHDPIKKAEAVNNLINSIALIPDTIKRATYIKETAKLLDTEEKAIYTQINKKLRKSTKDYYYQKEKKEKKQTEILQKQPITDNFKEKDIMYWLLKHGNEEIELDEDETKKISTIIFENIEEDEIKIENELLNKIYQEYLENYKSQKDTDIKTFIYHQDKEVSKFTVNLINSKYTESTIWKSKFSLDEYEKKNIMKLTNKSIYDFKDDKIKKILEKLYNKLKEDNSIEEIIEINSKIQILKKLTLKLSKKLGGRVISA